MSLLTITGQAFERTGVILMARILGHGGAPITQASVSTITYEIGYIDTPTELRAPLDPATHEPPVRLSDPSLSLNVSDVIFDSLQNQPLWLVTAAAPAVSGATELFVDPLTGKLPIGQHLTFPTGTATLQAVAESGARRLQATVTGTIQTGHKAVAQSLRTPASGPWKVDEKGYNFRFDLPATALPEIPISQYPEPRYYVVSIELTPVTGQAIAWEYRIEAHHRLYGKWVKE